jgi:hypothetical protein
MCEGSRFRRRVFFISLTKGEYQHMKNARELVTKVFPPGWDFMPEEKSKSQKFYEFILVDSGSVILSHTSCKFDPDLKRIAFSKYTIKNVLSPA